MRKRYVLGLVLLLSGSLVVLVSRGLSRPKSVPVYEVRRTGFARIITAEGVLKAANATAVTAPSEAEGPLKVAFIVADGSTIRKGDVVVRFDPTEFEDLLRDGRGDRASTENKISNTTVLAEADRSNLVGDAEQAARELEAAQRFQKKDAEIFSRSSRIESEIDGELATRRRAYARSILGIREAVSRADHDLLAIDERKADLKIRRARNGLAEIEIRAPHDGILVLTRDWRGEMTRIGDTVWGGEPLGEIPDLKRMKAEVFVLEADAGGLAPGQKATLSLDAAPGRAYEARVSRLDAVAKPRMRGVPVQFFGATLEVDRTDPETMKPGARVRARLVVAQQDDAVTVPLQAIFQKGSRKVVFVRRGSGFEERAVETGQSSLGRVVVVGGLRAGERIALKNPMNPPSDSSAPRGGDASREAAVSQ